MTALSQHVAVDRTPLRSINIERDLDRARALDGYVLSARAAEGLQRVLAANGQVATRAWSVAGPYGSGKSAYAHLLAGLFSAKGSPTRKAAERVLRSADSETLKRLRAFRRAAGVDERGMIRAVATARREPAADTLLRALHLGCTTFWTGRGRRPRFFAEIDRERRSLDAGAHCDPRRVLELFEAVISAAPILVIVDEFGKCLEFAAQDSAEGDLFLMQQLAERLSGREETQGLLFTLQHLAFEDYVGLASTAQRREWRKVQGRFEELPFVNDERLGWRMVSQAITPAEDAAVRRGCEASVADALEAAARLDLTLPTDVVALASECYPLHPIALWVLPELASRFGQSERTLGHFLTGESPGSVSHFLEEHSVEDGYPLLRVAKLFDFFVSGGGEGAGLGEEGARLREVQLRLEEVDELDEFEVDVAKTIAALNLVSSGGSERASRATLEAAMSGVTFDGGVPDLDEALERLHERGVVVYREFADEYRVWRGSDFDVAAAIGSERNQLEHALGPTELPLDEITRAHPLRPVVAARHSQQTETLRFFEQVYSSSVPDEEAPACSRRGFDGLVILLFGAAPSQVPAKTQDGRPLVIVTSAFGQEVRAAALDAAATLRTLKRDELESDPVARTEVRHRAAQAQALLAERMKHAFEADRGGTSWFADGVEIGARPMSHLSSLLSDLCDHHYRETPRIASEMLNRHELTSQASQARRGLIESLFHRCQTENLGIEGFGPERAIYEALFSSTGIHRRRDDVLTLGAPAKASGVSGAWKAIERYLDRATEQVHDLAGLYEELLSPPYGMKEGPIPLLIAAVLQARSDDVLVYEEGTYQPRVGPEHIERLIKTPARFAVKRLALDGARSDALAGVRELLSSPDLPEARNADALSVVRPLILFAQGLPDYTRQTAQLSEQARAVREALYATREPDELMFSALPAALGYPPLGSDASAAGARDFTAALAGALRELEAAYPTMLDRMIAHLREVLGVKGPPGAVREDLRTRSRHLLDAVIEPQMRSFLRMASDTELDDSEWIEALAMTVHGTPPQTWVDEDLAQFEAEANERAQWFRRLELLHYEMAVKPRKGYDVRRVTVTAPDGTEMSELAWIDKTAVSGLGEIAEDVITRVRNELGPRSVEALVAVLAEKVAAERDRTPRLREVNELDSAA
jgi:hypothetical protein